MSSGCTHFAVHSPASMMTRQWQICELIPPELIRQTGVGLSESASSVLEQKLQNATVTCGLSLPLLYLYYLYPTLT
jgi:hypothetical protein